MCIEDKRFVFREKSAVILTFRKAKEVLKDVGNYEGAYDTAVNMISFCSISDNMRN
jgi:hypothetical protein